MKRVLIAGAGPGGLNLSLALARQEEFCLVLISDMVRIGHPEGSGGKS